VGSIEIPKLPEYDLVLGVKSDLDNGIREMGTSVGMRSLARRPSASKLLSSPSRAFGVFLALAPVLVSIFVCSGPALLLL